MQAQAVRPEQTQVSVFLLCCIKKSLIMLQDALTAAQSLQSIQTLLRAGLGCITYLRWACAVVQGISNAYNTVCNSRNLLPADNFSESMSSRRLHHLHAHAFELVGYLTSAALEPQPSESINDSFSSESARRNISGFKIMTVTRGFTEEADKLLDYLVGKLVTKCYKLTKYWYRYLQEHGVFDALQKQYLRSFIFAVYLVSVTIKRSQIHSQVTFIAFRIAAIQISG